MSSVQTESDESDQRSLGILTDGGVSSAEVVVGVAGRVGGASLGGLRAAVMVVVVVDEALALGGALGGVVHDHHGGFYT